VAIVGLGWYKSEEDEAAEVMTEGGVGGIDSCSFN
jgi:hypothetical protein